MNRTLQSDIDNFSLPVDIINRLRDTRIVVTGASGLIGSSIVRCLSALNIGIRFILPVRNAKRFLSTFGPVGPDTEVVESELTPFFEQRFPCDYIIHCASPTDGAYMSGHPVETFQFITESTRAILDHCRRDPVGGMVFLSSIEYYGQIFNDDPITESDMGRIDHQSPRSSYPLGKQAAEFLCSAYANEYGVPTRIARITQTFGAGIRPTDNRVFAQFARSAIAHSDIVMHTEGLSAKPYLYTTDCVAALMYILTKGSDGEAYNVATPGSFVSIRELAQLYKDHFAPDINLVIDTSKANGYAAHTRVNLDASKVMALGWQPQYTLTQMLERLIDYLNDGQN